MSKHLKRHNLFSSHSQSFPWLSLTPSKIKGLQMKMPNFNIDTSDSYFPLQPLFTIPPPLACCAICLWRRKNSGRCSQLEIVWKTKGSFFYSLWYNIYSSSFSAVRWSCKALCHHVRTGGGDIKNRCSITPSPPGISQWTGFSKGKQTILYATALKNPWQ